MLEMQSHTSTQTTIESERCAHTHLFARVIERVIMVFFSVSGLSAPIKGGVLILPKVSHRDQCWCLVYHLYYFHFCYSF